MEMLVVDGLCKSYGQVQVLKDVNLRLDKGTAKAIIGPSGTGKSTLLRCINLLTIPDSGRVWLDGVEITDSKANINALRSQIGMVFQHFNLFLHMSALNNVAVGLIEVKKMKKKAARKLALEELEAVGLGDKHAAYPAELSGGQMQRVGIARALVMNPKLMLFDEPTSALDPELIGEVLGVISKLVEADMTMIIVTHEVGFARASCDKIVFMDEGVIVEEGSPEVILDNPQQARTKQFLGKIYELYG